MKTQWAPRRLSAQLPRSRCGALRRHRDDRFAVEHQLAVDAGIAMQAYDAAFGYQLDHLDDRLHHVADLHRAVEVERLGAINRAGAGQAGTEYGRDQARGIEPV